MSEAPVPRPVAWRVHPDDAARTAADGMRCEVRRCRNNRTVVTWRYWRSAEAGRVLAEHEICEEHGREFAARHHIEIEPAPAEPSRLSRRSGTKET